MKRKVLYLLVVFALVLGTVSVVDANHSWGSYHWARTANPFTLKLGDNLSPSWDPFLRTTSNDWSLSSVINTTIIGGLKNARTCKPTLGRAEICNYKYGRNGWLGIASIWVNGGGHITQGIVKVNDTYFNSAPYNTTAWKNLVMCQEVGHIFGLDHQDEDFNNLPLGTCMDYTNDPIPNQHPNAHDYEMLEGIYTHLDTTTTLSQTSTFPGRGVLEPRDVNLDEIREWGKQIKKSSNRRSSMYEKDLGRGDRVFTFVVWADQEASTDNRER
ncbi:MAG: hypothetical protein A3E93_01410 [Candidatus Zambryskibacteria bacterium RIFCSPHIGHO2_12_FULL_43_12b]|uniref:Peptidase M10 metallopeptidase domain-containing protein n=1 Tax=Candidatus Zambryskibacteria bacterium RIFCSPLOWO2_01_FULL_43_17 TaxID=1802760 RepID=A0A1G2U600_9BACT|nr:MAG: hypothetical protein A3E93_01410 [Candidatus Zambryskibacteria bacterium RIFCSPHIGHO2_12_FULL_43_12b]OHB04916.1 MAG: hypothetical protein A2920_02670 [Candidatus Zambryskibacteria bacterium RIFCSPLOWO2_01_FULL_43_17]